MNPLSSIHTAWPGTLVGSVLPGAPGAETPVSIPAAELRALDSASPGQSSSVGSASGSSFANLVSSLVQDVNTKAGGAAQALQDLQNGQSTSLHQSMIAMEEANVSFQLMVEVRNRLLDSYQELMRLQV